MRVQTAIRDALNRRYDMHHYLYNAFHQSSESGAPIMRAMWFEFPDDDKVYDIATQFMWGDSFLVAPKIIEPNTVLSSMHKQEVKFYLPEGPRWYYYYDKMQYHQTGW